MLDPEVKGVGQMDAERTLARVLAHRAWVDQRRGWRFTNPNLEELGLIRADSFRSTILPQMTTRSPLRRSTFAVQIAAHAAKRCGFCLDISAMASLSRPMRSIPRMSKRSRMPLVRVCASLGPFQRKKLRGLQQRSSSMPPGGRKRVCAANR
jgi:hypothetical protein